MFYGKYSEFSGEFPIKMQNKTKVSKSQAKRKKKLEYFSQTTDYTCGPASVRMALNFFGISKSEKQLAKLLNTDSRKGTRISNLISGVKSLGFEYVSKSNAKIQDLRVFQKKGYIIVVCYFIPEENLDHYSILKKIGLRNIYFFDPWFGEDHKYSKSYFKKIWRCDERFDQEKKWFLALKK